MLSPVARTFVFMAGLILLVGCETLGLTNTTASETDSIARPSQTTSDRVSAEPPPQPPKTVKEPTPVKPPVVSKKLKVAVLDSGDYAQAKARHLQTLVQNKVKPLTLADVGYYMDVQNAQFIQLLQQTSIDIKHEGDFIVLTMPGSDSFGKNSLRLKPSAEQALALASQVLTEYTETQIAIHGHTDDSGEAEYNKKLSVRRALLVADYLVNAGIAIERIAVIGFGESLPLSLSTTAEGRAQNRRIELYLEPIAK